MVDNNTAKYKYLVLRVLYELNPAGSMYKYSYTIMGIEGYSEKNVLGFYDDKMVHPVILMSNKNIFEYDWSTVPSRIRTGNYKEYLSMFQDEHHIIVVSDSVVEDGGFKLSHTVEGYTFQFINSSILDYILTENYTDETLAKDEKKRQQREAKRDDEWARRYRKISEENRPKIVFIPEIENIEKQKKKKFHIKGEWLAAVATFLCLVGVIAGAIISSKAIERFNKWVNSVPFEVTAAKANAVTTTTKNPYTRAQQLAEATTTTSVFEPDQIDTAEIQAKADSIYAIDVRHRADSIAKYITVHDSIIKELPETKKVQIELAAVIEDGITTRRVQTSVILDTIRDVDMKHLTNTITTMATNMAKDRVTEIDTSSTYYKMKNFNRNNIISLE